MEFIVITIQVTSMKVFPYSIWPLSWIWIEVLTEVAGKDGSDDGVTYAMSNQISKQITSGKAHGNIKDVEFSTVKCSKV